MNGKDTILFSKKSDEWETPRWLFDKLDKEFYFLIDASATTENTKCKIFISHDSLSKDWYALAKAARRASIGMLWEGGWRNAIYLNPPYSKIAAFMRKAYEESLKGAVVVCLIPCRTDTRYWHDYVMKAHEIRFIRGRLKFGNEKNSAPFPSCIVVFNHSKYDKNNDPLFTTTGNTP